ncbi:RNA polymerase sigma factor [Pontibacter sp. SGAir0037]|uniref:RNA polymerase sigma factor n=1 Tax=Pontibacter sp. SGAir0037 TaxID=2571030 RepID=UPI0010CD643A|nr:sigma-70 family RNA polymerase sigma factor [Pontibacter sp. SGAir0037]QCR21456.1 RNA polymerase subunit sigma-24 [Pontibacter sp. SGAir0037]
MFLKLFSKSRPPDDLELVQKYQKTGDLACIGELFERHTETVYLVCLKYLKDEEESKDATMQVFEGLVETLKKHQVTNFKSWLHVIAKNHCLMQLRAAKSKEKLFLKQDATGMELASNMHLTEEKEEREIEFQYLEQGLEKLPLEQRTCVELFYLQQKSYKEIAAITGCELHKVKSYIQNGKRNLKLYLQNNNGER